LVCYYFFKTRSKYIIMKDSTEHPYHHITQHDNKQEIVVTRVFKFRRKYAFYLMILFSSTHPVGKTHKFGAIFSCEHCATAKTQ